LRPRANGARQRLEQVACAAPPRQVPLPGALSARPRVNAPPPVVTVAAPARDRTVHCSIGVNAPGVNADEQVAGQS
jgi:hypothetical protein